MSILATNDRSRYHSLIGVGGLGTGIFFALDGDSTLGRSESRPGKLLDVRDFCKLHIVIHYVAKLLGCGAPKLTPFRILPVGKVGNDSAGQRILEELRSVGVDVSLVKSVEDTPTLHSVCFQYPDGTGGNITSSNSAAAELRVTDLDEAAVFLRAGGNRSIALLVPEVQMDVRRRFLEMGREAGAFCVGSFASTEIAIAKEYGMFEMLDLVALNDAESEALTGSPLAPTSPESFVNKCRSLTESVYRDMNLIVSAGSHGAYGFSGGNVNFCPAPAVPVASTAGAGDALLGGVISAIAAGLPFLRSPSPLRRNLHESPLTTALEFGVLLASFKVGSPHTIHPAVSINALLRFAAAAGAAFDTDALQMMMRSPMRQPISGRPMDEV